MNANFSAEQAEALSRLLAETATRTELFAMEERLISRMEGMESTLRAEIATSIAGMRAEMKASIAELRTEVVRMSVESETRMMRWGITMILSMIISMATIFTLLDIFID
ncbi:MAG: hypothetical protein WD423_00240 [Rhodothermales bacterium]